eukprot:PhF_6_TR8719/c0_g1_i2/m.13687
MITPCVAVLQNSSSSSAYGRQRKQKNKRNYNDDDDQSIQVEFVRVADNYPSLVELKETSTQKVLHRCALASEPTLSGTLHFGPYLVMFAAEPQQQQQHQTKKVVIPAPATPTKSIHQSVRFHVPSCDNNTSTTPNFVLRNVPLVHTIKDYQIEGVTFMLQATLMGTYAEPKGCILADDMGLGKTVQVLTYLHLMISYGFVQKAVLCVSCSTQSNWLSQRKKWFGGTTSMRFLTASECESKQDDLRAFTCGDACNVLLISYDQLSRVVDRSLSSLRCDVLICDEGHKLRNENCVLRKKLEEGTNSNGFQTARRVLVTATPMQNAVSELRSLITFVLHKPHSDTQLDPEQLKSVMLRREAHQIQMPPCTIYRVQCQGAAMSSVVTLAEASRVRSMVGPKVSFLRYFAQKVCDSTEEEAMVIASYSVRVLDEIAEVLRENFRCPIHQIDGRINIESRSTVLDAFQRRGGILLLSGLAGGEGINLQRANRMI